MVVAFIIAAVVTPPDVISQLALAVPMCILYEIGILGAGWFSRVSKAPEEETEPGTAVDKPADDKPVQ
jgi:sec-independent protein translocase protein TatC